MKHEAQWSQTRFSSLQNKDTEEEIEATLRTGAVRWEISSWIAICPSNYGLVREYDIEDMYIKIKRTWRCIHLSSELLIETLNSSSTVF